MIYKIEVREQNAFRTTWRPPASTHCYLLLNGVRPLSGMCSEFLWLAVQLYADAQAILVECQRFGAQCLHDLGPREVYMYLLCFDREPPTMPAPKCWVHGVGAQGFSSPSNRFEVEARGLHHPPRRKQVLYKSQCSAFPQSSTEIRKAPCRDRRLLRALSDSNHWMRVPLFLALIRRHKKKGHSLLLGYLAT